MLRTCRSVATSGSSRRRCSMWCAGDMCTTLFFFFQAEDGIRDLTVTGVQTCALPIWATAVARTCGDTTFTIVELTGPVDANRSSSAATMAVQYTGGADAARATSVRGAAARSEEHTSELQSQSNLVCRLLLEKKNKDASDVCVFMRRTA